MYFTTFLFTSRLFSFAFLFSAVAASLFLFSVVAVVLGILLLKRYTPPNSPTLIPLATHCFDFFCRLNHNTIIDGHFMCTHASIHSIPLPLQLLSLVLFRRFAFYLPPCRTTRINHLIPIPFHPIHSIPSCFAARPRLRAFFFLVQCHLSIYLSICCTAADFSCTYISFSDF